MSTKWIDLNSILIGSNLLITGLLVYALSLVPGNPYADRQTVLLGLLLCAQTHGALWLERRHRDPFVILLAFDNMFYYSLRIFTLTWYPFSDVFDRYPYDASDSNYALVFILVANLALYCGLYLVKIKGDQAVDATAWKATSSTSIVLLMIATIFFAYFSDSSGDADSGAARLLSVLGIFLTPNVIVLMALSYLVLFRKSLNPTFSVSILMLIAIEMIVHTLFGSRSAIIVIVQNGILVGLGMWGCIRIRSKYLLMGVALLPVFVGLLVASFAISTYNRAVRVVGAPFDIGKAYDTAKESSSGLSIQSSLDLVLRPLFSRTGYFDYSAEIIAHREQYRWIINPTAYAKSIVDNILTPGFDVYDQPKIGNALHFAYQDMGPPSKSQLANSDTYQSDQLGVYGEFYGLFSWGCLPILFAGAYLLKAVYVRLRSVNPFNLLMKRVIVLLIFARAVDSYGVDWTIEEAIPLVVAILIYGVIFSVKRRQPPDDTSIASVRSGAL